MHCVVITLVNALLHTAGHGVAHAFELLNRSLRNAQDWHDKADRLSGVPATIQNCQQLLKDWDGVDLRCSPAAAIVLLQHCWEQADKQDSCNQ